MTKKQMVLAPILGAVILVNSAYGSEGDSKERKVFDSGIRSALKVLKYEKEKSIEETDKQIRNKFCVSLNRTGDQSIKPFDVVKMESLSLYLEYEPMYLLHSNNGEVKNLFCFARGNTKDEAKAKLKAIRARYPKIDNYNPKIEKLKSAGTYKRAIPFLGIWSKDMSNTVQLLNEKVESQSLVIKKDNAHIKELSSSLETVVSTIKAKTDAHLKKYHSGKVLSSFGEASSRNDMTSDFDNTSAPKIEKVNKVDKKTEKAEKIVKAEKKKIVKKVSEEKVVIPPSYSEMASSESKKDKVIKSDNSARVFTIEH